MTLLLIPGLNCTAELFAPLVPHLAGVPWHVADHGGGATIEAIAATILASAPPRFALGGLSMGGYVAFEIMRQAPWRVTHLALMNTRATQDTPDEADRRRQTIAMALSGRFDALHGIFWPRLVHVDRLGDTHLEDIVQRMRRDTGPDAFVRQQQALLARSAYRDLLPTIRVPTAVIVGEGDVITPPDDARAMAALISQATLDVLPRCGHLSTLEAPAAVAAVLSRLLKRESPTLSGEDQPNGQGLHM